MHQKRAFAIASKSLMVDLHYRAVTTNMITSAMVDMCSLSTWHFLGMQSFPHHEGELPNVLASDGSTDDLGAVDTSVILNTDCELLAGQVAFLITTAAETATETAAAVVGTTETGIIRAQQNGNQQTTDGCKSRGDEAAGCSDIGTSELWLPRVECPQNCGRLRCAGGDNSRFLGEKDWSAPKGAVDAEEKEKKEAGNKAKETEGLHTRAVRIRRVRRVRFSEAHNTVHIVPNNQQESRYGSWMADGIRERMEMARRLFRDKSKDDSSP